MKNVILYVRVSTDEQASKGYSLRDQEQKLVNYCKLNNLNILEIGILDGKSLLTWKDYYYRSNILGIDINPDCKKYEEERISVEIGSQADGEFLSRIWQQYLAYYKY